MEESLEKVWNLPYSTHCDILFELSNLIPVANVICSRILSLLPSVLIVTVILLKLLQFNTVT